MSIFYEQYLVIDYGTTHMKGVLYQSGPGSKKILRVESLPIISLQESTALAPVPSANGERPINPENLRGLGEYEYNVIRFIQSFFPEEQSYIINVPLDRVYVRDITVPIINAKQIKEVVPGEVENLIPVTMEEAEVVENTWEIEEDSSRVITFTSLHENLEAAVQPFLKGAATIRMLSLDAVGLAGIVHLLEPEDYKDRVIGQIDIGGARTTFNVVKNGELVFTRKLPVGGDDISDMIADTLKIDRSQADQKKIELELDLTDLERRTDKPDSFYKRHRIDLKTYNKLCEKAREIYEELCDEIDRSTLSLPCKSPDIFYLSGGASLQAGLLDFIRQNLETDVRPYPLDMTGDPVGIALWATALGTGEHYRLKTAQRIDYLQTPFGNTLRGGQFNVNIFATPLLFGVGSIIILLASFVASILLDYNEIDRYNQEIAAVAKKIPGLNGKGSNLVSEARRLCNRKLKAQVTGDNSVSFLGILKEITSKTPGRDELPFKLKRLRYYETGVDFSGEVNGSEKISLLRKKLRESGLFSKVEVERNLILGERWKVNVKITLNDNKASRKDSCK